MDLRTLFLRGRVGSILGLRRKIVLGVHYTRNHSDSSVVDNDGVEMSDPWTPSPVSWWNVHQFNVQTWGYTLSLR